MSRTQNSRTELARLGFAELSTSRELLASLPAHIVPLFAQAADPDQALRLLIDLGDPAAELLDDDAAASRLIAVLGASHGLGEFFLRHPGELSVLRDSPDSLDGPERLRKDLLAAVKGKTDEAAWLALRVRYRRHLARIAAWDLGQADPLQAIDPVTAALADLAAAAVEAALDVARRSVPFPAEQVAATRFAIIGMGKTGARELNYVSDVDVIFVAEPADDLPTDRAMEIGTRLAIQTMRAIQEVAAEPALWQVDANLRPEGRDGALVRTLDSHLAYYERWAKSWEFQALLKARPIAGDRDLGERYVAGTSPKVWSSAGRENFVESVQRMRERVTEHIPADEVELQLKLGPGGIRDVEFTIQLLQLVHGQHDESVRQAATLPALEALAEAGYIGRTEAGEFARDYRFLRLLEHRLQLDRLQRTHRMPEDPERLRVLARATGLHASADGLAGDWRRTKQRVRSLHERLFYRPLLSAVAALPESTLALTSEQATARLAAIGFADPEGALRHIGRLTSGVSRRATIQRALLPVLLQWFAEGADPDGGLLAFRRLSEALGDAPWFLRMLRDSSAAAQNLTRVLSASGFVGDLLERIPEAAAWLEQTSQLRPRPLGQLLDETRATVARHTEDPDAAALALRHARRREVLRLALASILGTVTVQELGHGLSDVTTAIISGALELAHRDDGLEFGVIAMGRFGGSELGFGSDADVMYVYRSRSEHDDSAQTQAERIVREINRLTEDLRLPLELDIGLRPEGKNGAIVRSLESYRAYYERWSLTWEAQALLRARGVAGDERLLRDFEALADEVRYPAAFSDADEREVKRIKARVESERLPRGADPARHLKLGRGSISDVEWLVQLLQLRHAARVAELRTTSTLSALSAAVAAELLDEQDARKLEDAWLLASRVRSAMTLWTSKTTDVLPADRRDLEGAARLLEYPPGSASVLEDDYLRVTRRARHVFERLFYGAPVRRGDDSGE